MDKNIGIILFLVPIRMNQNCYVQRLQFAVIFTGGEGLATRVCMLDEDQGAVWLEPIYVGCGEMENVTLADLPEV